MADGPSIGTAALPESLQPHFDILEADDVAHARRMERLRALLAGVELQMIALAERGAASVDALVLRAVGDACRVRR